jgi:predicted aldo/keto reductase-like oxidoreductase
VPLRLHPRIDDLPKVMNTVTLERFKQVINIVTLAYVKRAVRTVAHCPACMPTPEGTGPRRE